MDLETTQTTTIAKLPILKQVAQITTNADGTSTSLTPGPVTIKEKVQKKNDVKERSMLLMALPNEHLMTFNQYKDAKTLCAAIQTRFGGNEATNKTQKTLLKQMYENFSAPSTEYFDSIFNRLQKIISQLAILGENISHEDLNLKFLRSLPSDTHVMVWRNKPDLDIMSFNNLYNNFKIVEQEVKGTASSSSSSSSQNMDFVSSPSSTNEVNTAYGVSTANTQVSPASTQVSTTSTQVSTANLSDDTVYAFLASQPNGSQLIYEDLEQFHEDDIEEMYLKWKLALLSMRTKRFFQKTNRKITINRSDTAGYDKSKVKCFNCHKMGHFARECRGPRNQDSRNRNQDSSKRTVNVEETSSKAMVDIDGAGFDWSYMADDEVPTNMALMAFSNSEFNLATYKRWLASVEEQLVFHKRNEVIFYEQLAVLKIDISYKDSEINMLKSELEKLKQEKESNQLKIKKFDNASKSLDKLIGSQIPDKSRKGVGLASYNVVPPPPTGLFSFLNLDLSYSRLEEFQQPKFKGYGPKSSKSVSEDISNEVRESLDAPWVEELVSDDKLEKKIVFPIVAKMEFVRLKQQEKLVKKPIKYAEMYRSQSPKGNQRNWNNQKSQQLGSDFVMNNKACFVCGSFDHVQANCNYHQKERVVSGNNYTRVNYNYSAKKAHPSAHRNMIPRAVLIKTGLRSLNTARPVNTAHPKTIVYSARSMSHFSKSAQSTVKRPYQIRTTLTNKNSSQKVNTSKGKFYTARPKAVNTARPNSAVVDAVRANQTSRNLMDDMLPLGEELKEEKLLVKELLKTVPVVALHRTLMILVVLKGSNGYRSSSKETRSSQDYILMPLWKDGSLFDSSLKNASNDEPQPSSNAEKKDDEGVNKESRIDDQERPENSTQDVNTARPSINTTSTNVNTGSLNINTISPTVTTALLEATHVDFFGDETEIDMSNITTTYLVPSTPNTRIHKDDSLDHVIGDVYRNKKDERGIVVRNKARLVTQGYTQEKGIDYDEVFALVARIEAIRLFLAYASFMNFVVYQMDVKSELCKEKALYGLHQAPRAWYETLSTYLMDNGFQRGQIDKTLFIKRVKSDILLVQVYVDDIIFGSTKKEFITEYLRRLDLTEVPRYSMGELTGLSS
ncbi:ribonuclease H-like domain-containing protein [Tanacetum coccineum]